MAVRLTEGTPEQILSTARLHDDQDETAKKVEDLSNEAIEFARARQRLPVERRAVMVALQIMNKP
jgi:hypothetical protein